MGTALRPSSPARTDILQVRIQLMWLRPTIWRRVCIPATITLDRLHRVIQAAMGWSNKHLHQFVIGRQRYGRSDPLGTLSHRVISESKVKLNAALKDKKALRYLYDFGDYWEHELKIEKLLPAETSLHAFCVAGERACPPEDVGGVSGYMDFIHAILDPHHAEHKEMLQWCGGAFDPNAFDIDDVNRSLQRIKV